MTLATADDHRLAPIMLRGELIERGFTDKAIRCRVQAGQWVKLRWGAYVPAAPFHALDARGQHALVSRAVLRQANTTVSLSHASALAWLDAPDFGLDLSGVHVTRHDGKAGRREAGVHQHCGVLVEGDLVDRHGVSMTSPTRAALETTTLTSVEAGLVQVNHLLHAGLTTESALQHRYDQMTEWPHTLNTEIVLRLADRRIESVGESRSYHLCYCYSLPMPEPQFEVRDSAGNVIARLDFAWPELGKWLEFDGRVKYEKLLREGERASDVVLRERRREDAVRRATGWDCIRWAWVDLDRPHRTANELRSFLGA